ncbi:CHAT domain-containing protein [Mycena epipterygia]|nr:CHAT domain-containing protein [Mycena epipterygia]
MSTSINIRLHDIEITSLSTPHDDLPPGMQMFAQLIVDGVIVQQTMPVDSEDNQDSLSWKLQFDCEIPQDANTFGLAIMREIRGTRLLGSAEIGQHEVVLFAEQQLPFCVPLVKVNLDGPPLQLSAAFSISSSTPEPSNRDGNNIPGIQIGSLNNEEIMADLEQMFNFTESESQLDPQELLVIHERILLLPTANDTRASFLNLLGEICLQQWQSFHMMDVLNVAVCAYDDALRDSPGDTNSLPDLGIVLLLRFEQLGNVDDITKCVSVMEQVVSLTPDTDPDKLSWLSNLGSSLDRRFQCLGDLGDLEKAISIGNDAMGLTPDHHPERPAILSSLANSLLTRFKHLGDLDDLNGSVLIGEDAVHLTPDGHPDKPLKLNNLSGSLLTRFEHLGDLDDLNESLVMAENAVCLTPDGHPAKPYWLTNLGNSLLRRFKRLGDNNDLNKAVSLGEDAVGMTPYDNHNKPSVLTSLGTFLLTRFECLGDLADLNDSILRYEDAVHLTSDSMPVKPLRLNNLATSLLTRFECLGDLSDLNRSMLKAEEAIRLTPDGHLAKPSRLNILGDCLFQRFERLGNLDDLNKSVALREDAIYLTPDGHPAKPTWMNNLGGSLVPRFLRIGDLGDLNKSVSMLEDAILLTPDGQPNKPLFMNNLSNSLLTRFKHLSDLGDLNQAVLLQENAVCLTPEGHPGRPFLLNNLGKSLHIRFEHLGDKVDLQNIILHCTSAARSTTGPADVRFDAASLWGKYAKIGPHPSLMDAYNVSLDLLPELAWLGLSISDRHYHLLKAGKVVRDAAAAAIAAGQAEKAVEWLEQGRSVIWGQVLNLRTPVDSLKNSHPELAKKLLSLSAQLEGSGARASNLETIESGVHQPFQSVADQAHRNAYEREELLKQIRALEGFSRFLLPRTVSDLSQAAQRGPVVILNINDNRSDALILMPGRNEVMHIPLTEFTPKHATKLVQSFGELVGRGGRLTGTREGQLNIEDQFALSLSKLWVGVVRPVLNALAITTPTKTNLQRIWWCPMGALVFLPIHAAGFYGKDEHFGSKLSDFVISSYAPSLTALIEGLRPPSETQKVLQLLAVAQPSAVGQHYIPGTQKEITHIEQLAIGKLPVLRLDEDMATVESVQQGMRESQWVHLACHGIQDVFHPIESALLLAGSSRLTLSNIIQLALPHADFAFLSACQTATGDKALQEESVHLAARMLLAGYRGVIATMWTIRDNDTPQLARDVYEHLFKKSPPDPTQAAEALHLAVRNFCEESGMKKPFSHWVPFIHVGV